MHTVSFVFLGQPTPKQSARFSRNGHCYQKKEIVLAEEKIRQQVMEQLPENFQRFEKFVIVEKILFVFEPLKSFKKSEKEIIEAGGYVRKTTKPDITDNLNKLLFDSMNELVYRDDSIICELQNSKKVYGKNPRIEIILSGE